MAGSKEIIVVDDGSTDETGEIAQGDLPQEGVTVVTTKNGGLCAALNCAYKHWAKETTSKFPDADDLLPPDKIERQLAALTASDSKRILLFAMGSVLPSDAACSFRSEFSSGRPLSC